MAADSSQANSDFADIFEVFKVARTPNSQLQALPLQTVQKKFTILSPITSLDQLKGPVALATLPAPGHVVVDQSKFKEMFAEKAKEAAIQQSSAILDKTDKVIENLKKDFEEELKTIIKMIQETIRTEQNKTVEAVAEIHKRKGMTEAERQHEVESVVANQSAVVEKVLDLLAHKDFNSSVEVRENSS